MADLEQFSNVFDENEETISDRVFGDADATIDKRPGEMFHDITIPVVQEMARLWDAVNSVAAVTFIPWSNGIYLDYKGTFEIGVPRKKATASGGEITFVGDIAAQIPANTRVQTIAYNATDPIYEFRTTVNEIIGMSLPQEPEYTPTAVDGIASTGPVGDVEYKYSWVGRGGETECSPPSALFTSTKAVEIQNITVGPYGTTARNIYRKKDGETDFALVHTIDNNSDTAWEDDDPNPTDPNAPLEAVGLNTTDRVTVPAESLQTGLQTNVGAESVTSMPEPPSGVDNAFNEAPFKGAVADEDDDAYRERLIKAVSLWQGQGNVDDYRRWAAMNEKVDDALVLVPGDTYKDEFGDPVIVGPSCVHLILLGPDNTSVTQVEVDEVQERIDPNSEGKGYGYAPIGAIVSVEAAKEVVFTVEFDVYFEPGYSLDGENETSPSRFALNSSVDQYFRNLPAGGDVIWAEVLASLVMVTGVANVKNLVLRYDGTDTADDVEIDPSEVPVLEAGGVVATDQTVRP